MASISESKSELDFIKGLNRANPNIELVGKYLGSHKKTMFKCKIDGCEWLGYPSNLLNRSAGCPYCNTSIGERLMVDALNELGLRCIQQYTISGCKRIHNLKFDAFQIDKNIAFEYNGEQHYRPVDFAGKGKEWACRNFDLTKERDSLKKKFCDDNGIEMIVVPYWERNNIKEYIQKQLKDRCL